MRFDVAFSLSRLSSNRLDFWPSLQISLAVRDPVRLCTLALDCFELAGGGLYWRWRRLDLTIRQSPSRSNYRHLRVRKGARNYV